MNCDHARDLLFDEQDNLLTPAAHADLHAHLAACAACRTEFAQLAAAADSLAEGLRTMTATIAPSAAFWQGLEAGLDAEDAGRVQRPLKAPARLRTLAGPRSRLIRRWVGAVGLAAALLAGLLATGNLEQAWASLRRQLHFLPIIGVGQVDRTALVSTASAHMSNGTLTLTVTELVGGRRSTLLAYRISGPALAAPDASAQVADAVDATLVGAHGRRYIPLYVLPSLRGSDHGVPVVTGGLAFTPLARDERSLSLAAARLPLAPAGRPWSVRITVSPVDAAAAQTSLPIDSSATHQGIRLTVTDFTRTSGATVVDMAAQIDGGPHAGGTVISLAPEAAVGPFAPVLTLGQSTSLAPRLSPLPAPVRLATLSQPEFLFGPLPAGHGPLSVLVPAVQVRGAAQAGITVRTVASTAQTVRLGDHTLGISSQIVTPSAALGLGDAHRLRLKLTFPKAGPPDTLQGVTVVVGGVSYLVGRDTPTVDIPLIADQQILPITLEQPLITVYGPWVIVLPDKTS